MECFWGASKAAREARRYVSIVADLASRFHLLKYGLALVLIFIGTKMLIVEWFKIPVFLSLGVVAAILVTAVAASWLIPEKKAASD